MTPIDVPPILYKYRCCDANSLSLLAVNQLYLARVEAFNDPFEFLNPAATLDAACTTDPDVTFADLERKHRTDDFHASMRVCSLTEVCDDLLMWGHYTDCHKGFCIRFEFAEDDIRRSLFPVQYEDKLPDYTQRIEKSMDVLRLAALTKSAHWAYEREWRLISHVAQKRARTGECLTRYRSESITGIIFGLRTLSPHKALVRKVLQDHSHIKYFQAYKSHNAFSLSIRALNANGTVIPMS